MAAEDQQLSGFMQENVLTLLCYSSRHSTFVSNAVGPNDFESSVYRSIASAASSYIAHYKAPPGDHIADLLEDKLKDENTKELYTDVLTNIHETSSTINEQYVVNQLTEFVRKQRIKAGILEGVEYVNQNRITDAENALLRALKNRADVFEKGIRLGSSNNRLEFLEHAEETLPTGIEHVDKYHLGPAPQTMWLLIGAAKAGKSWALVHMGKMAALSGRRVLHVTLEMPEWQVSQRYMQSLFSVSKRKGEFFRAKIIKRRKSDFASQLEPSYIQNRPHLGQDDIRKVLNEKLDKLGAHRLPLIIKQFPTGMLTLSGLRAYIETLARTENFIPDLIIVDYPDLMDVEHQDQRIGLGKLYEKLRGLAIEYNVSLAVVTQSNREGAKEGSTIQDSNVAEDWSKIATADTVFTFNRTRAERDLGLARLWVSNARADRDKFSILLSQCTDVGQFALESALLGDNYWKLVKDHANEDDESLEEEDV